MWFRLTDDEYAKLTAFCEATRARSISDVARSAVRGFVESGRMQTDERFDGDIRSLWLKLNELSHSVQQLAWSLKQGLDMHAPSRFGKE